MGRWEKCLFRNQIYCRDRVSDPCLPTRACLMSTWIVGDVHGCYRTFLALLRRCRYEEQSDRLILVGDLVHGGPDSLPSAALGPGPKPIVSIVFLGIMTCTFWAVGRVPVLARSGIRSLHSWRRRMLIVWQNGSAGAH